ncbi:MULTISPECIES: hypothetical protein [unclassified Yoonia]|uniref:hypothetical protein n=1 Tax=unclassified Yoonia TaxID=2629118 RepID=UPI002AFEB6D4|nr:MULTISPECIES: hypothetical protein [unclassified Yoonia]
MPSPFAMCRPWVTAITLSPLFAAGHVAPAIAQSAACLTPVEVVETGEMWITLDDRTDRLVFIAVTVDDLLFDGAESISSAAVLSGENAAGGPYQIWSITAYPEGWVTELRQQLCGEDILDAIDAQRVLSVDGDPLAGAMVSLSPSQSVIQGYLQFGRAGKTDPDRLAAETAARAQLAAFESRLPPRDGVFLVNFRLPAPNLRDARAIEAQMAAIVSDPSLDPAEMNRRLEALMLGRSPGPTDPGAITCPCPMEIMEAHLFGADGPPFLAESRSWDTSDMASAPFGLTVTEIASQPDGAYRVTGQFSGAVFGMAPKAAQESAGSTFLDSLGLPDMDKSPDAIAISGGFTIDRVLSGDMTRLPKLF